MRRRERRGREKTARVDQETLIKPNLLPKDTAEQEPSKRSVAPNVSSSMHLSPESHLQASSSKASYRTKKEGPLESREATQGCGLGKDWGCGDDSRCLQESRWQAARAGDGNDWQC